MKCPQCGQDNDRKEEICSYCGKLLRAQAAPAPQRNVSDSPPETRAAGRGNRVLVLGILSIVMLGLLTGIPAWVMGRRDLRKIREGDIDPAQASVTRLGMVLGIIGTVIGSFILLLVLVALIGVFFGEQEESKPLPGSPPAESREPPKTSLLPGFRSYAVFGATQARVRDDSYIASMTALRTAASRAPTRGAFFPFRASRNSSKA
jgi:hypothetical protein